MSQLPFTKVDPEVIRRTLESEPNQTIGFNGFAMIPAGGGVARFLWWMNPSTISLAQDGSIVLAVTTGEHSDLSSEFDMPWILTTRSDKVSGILTGSEGKFSFSAITGVQATSLSADHHAEFAGELRALHIERLVGGDIAVELNIFAGAFQNHRYIIDRDTSKQVHQT